MLRVASATFGGLLEPKRRNYCGVMNIPHRVVGRRCRVVDTMDRTSGQDEGDIRNRTLISIGKEQLQVRQAAAILYVQLVPRQRLTIE